jgi:hypothetical protein
LTNTWILNWQPFRNCGRCFFATMCSISTGVTIVTKRSIVCVVIKQDKSSFGILWPVHWSLCGQIDPHLMNPIVSTATEHSQK